MNKLLHITLLACAVCLVGRTTSAQVPSKTVAGAGYLFEDVEGRNLWLSSSNVAGMRIDSLNISEAVLGGGYSQGNIDLEPPRQWNVGAYARSITHLKKFSMVGSFSFDQKSTYDDCGSMFLRPGMYPVDVLEFTPGKKSLQNYAFTGGISVDVAPGWTVGAELDFSSANYTKLKDLRYTDFILDLSLRPGVVWHSERGLQLGLSLRFDRNAETVNPEQVGAAATSYQAFLDKGLHYGLGGIWTNEALHLDEEGIIGFPVRCVSFGGALQIGWRGWLGELAYLYTDGKIGEKDAMWYQFPQHGISALVGKNFVSGAVDNTAKIELSFQRTNLTEAIMEKVTVGGASLRKIYGYNSIFNRSRLSVTPSWRAFRPGVFNASVSLTYNREDGITSIKYPVLCGETLQRVVLDASARAFIGRWSIPVSVYAAKGFLSEVNRNDEFGLPQRQDEYFEMWKTCNTGFDFCAALGVRHTFKQGIYLEAGGEFRTLEKMNRWGARLSVGYTF